MAARLMMKFSNAITCDETTQIKSSIPASQFTLAPPVTLKGIANPENIYSFSLERYVAMHNQIQLGKLIWFESIIALVTFSSNVYDPTFQLHFGSLQGQPHFGSSLPYQVEVLD